MTSAPMPPSAPAQPPMGWVSLTIQGSVMTSSMIPPKAAINGYLVPASYGLNQIPVPAGPVRVDLSAQWMRTYGQASLEFQLAEGQNVPVFYAAPLHQFTTGSIGFEPVKRKGVGVFVVILAAAILLPLLGLSLAFFL
ncbi:MAG: hypothetical protein QM621_04770 [Aeromicrobium sp.]|uniref:hypothetical protein n=1 Tax=Aeromicrobium sp. TaxID=1871063 RepID=UPI0039E6F650